MKVRKRPEIYDAWQVIDIITAMEEGEELEEPLRAAFPRLRLRVSAGGIVQGTSCHAPSSWLVHTNDGNFLFYTDEVFHRVFTSDMPAKPGPKPKVLPTE